MKDEHGRNAEIRDADDGIRHLRFSCVQSRYLEGNITNTCSTETRDIEDRSYHVAARIVR